MRSSTLNLEDKILEPNANERFQAVWASGRRLWPIDFFPLTCWLRWGIPLDLAVAVWQTLTSLFLSRARVRQLRIVLAARNSPLPNGAGSKISLLFPGWVTISRRIAIGQAGELVRLTAAEEQVVLSKGARDFLKFEIRGGTLSVVWF